MFKEKCQAVRLTLPFARRRSEDLSGCQHHGGDECRRHKHRGLRVESDLRRERCKECKFLLGTREKTVWFVCGKATKLRWKESERGQDIERGMSGKRRS